jgi:hypothetical protein
MYAKRMYPFWTTEKKGEGQSSDKDLESLEQTIEGYD